MKKLSSLKDEAQFKLSKGSKVVYTLNRKEKTIVYTSNGSGRTWEIKNKNREVWPV